MVLWGRLSIKIPRFGEQLVFGEMMLVHGYRADNALGEVVVMALEIEEELLHGAAGTGAGAEEQNFPRALQGLGNSFVEALALRLARCKSP